MQGIDINNSSVQQHAINMSFMLRGNTGQSLNAMEIWVPDGHLYIIDNLLVTNRHSSAVTTTIYFMQNKGSTYSYEDMAATHFLGGDSTTPTGRGAVNVPGIWRKAMDAATSTRPFGDSPFYLMAGQGLNMYTVTNDVVSASFSFRDCF
tara:strand:- start:195 stop:641 length:447 start_codon:yes stop_codon:yes gene_type:complete